MQKTLNFFNFSTIIYKEIKRYMKVTEQMFLSKTGIPFSKFYKKYRVKLIWFLVKKCNDETTAKDVADECLLRAFEEIDKFDKTKSNFATWLFTIANNQLIHDLKIQQKFDTFDFTQENVCKSNFYYLDERTSEQKKQMEDYKTDRIRESISKLSPIYSQALMMREIDNLEYESIAQYLDININTVKSRIKIGREKLKNLLDVEFHDLEESYDV